MTDNARTFVERGMRRMRNRITGTTYHLHAEADPHGYAVTVSTSVGMGEGYRREEFPMRDVDVPNFIRNLQASYETVQRRRLVDAICGDCSMCGNTRMVTEKKKNGYDSIEHCPRCTPKIAHASARGILA